MIDKRRCISSRLISNARICDPQDRSLIQTPCHKNRIMAFQSNIIQRHTRTYCTSNANQPTERNGIVRLMPMCSAKLPPLFLILSSHRGVAQPIRNDSHTKERSIPQPNTLILTPIPIQLLNSLRSRHPPLPSISITHTPRPSLPIFPLGTQTPPNCITNHTESQSRSFLPLIRPLHRTRADILAHLLQWTHSLRPRTLRRGFCSLKLVLMGESELIAGPVLRPLGVGTDNASVIICGSGSSTCLRKKDLVVV